MLRRSSSDLAAVSTLIAHQTFAAGEVVKLDVQMGAVATTTIAAAYVFGFLV